MGVELFTKRDGVGRGGGIKFVNINLIKHNNPLEFGDKTPST
jgi:hypothetical protein